MEVDGGKTGWLIDTIYNAPLCLEKKLVIKVENVVTVYFDFDKSLLRDRATQQLDSIYNVLVENPKATIQVSGYTDGLGSVEYNKILSDKRAKACADYLIAKGIDASRISFESFGACCPVEMEMINGRDNPDGRSMNRRALINIDKPAEE
jgi:outer membrane protein OmpA-like peptidoglycan-associated protein